MPVYEIMTKKTFPTRIRYNIVHKPCIKLETQTITCGENAGRLKEKEGGTIKAPVFLLLQILLQVLLFLFLFPLLHHIIIVSVPCLDTPRRAYATSPTFTSFSPVMWLLTKAKG